MLVFFRNHNKINKIWTFVKAEFPLCFRRGKAVLLPSPSREHPPGDAAASDAGPGGPRSPASDPAGGPASEIRAWPGNITWRNIISAVSFTVLTPGVLTLPISMGEVQNGCLNFLAAASQQPWCGSYGKRGSGFILMHSVFMR